MVKVDPKYVAMLNKAYEKYSKLEVVNSNFEHFSDSCDNKKKLLFDDTSSSTNSQKIVNKSLLKNKKSNVEDNSKKTKNFANYGKKRYSEEENEFIWKYLKKNSDICHVKAAEELVKLMKGRTSTSIRHQIQALLSRQTITVTARTTKKFSLIEDKLIIDEAIKHLKHCKSLREAVIQNPKEFSKSLNRRHTTVNERWDPFLKCWLLQYYNKSLNQEIRPMLVDLIHKNYDSVLDIDWEFVISHKEFSGYNIKGLKRKFVNTMDKAAAFLKKPSYELSLKEIANYAEEYFSNTVLRAEPTREKRKMDCIEYFERKIREQNIAFSET